MTRGPKSVVKKLKNKTRTQKARDIMHTQHRLQHVADGRRARWLGQRACENIVVLQRC